MIALSSLLCLIPIYIIIDGWKYMFRSLKSDVRTFGAKSLCNQPLIYFKITCFYYWKVKLFESEKIHQSKIIYIGSYGIVFFW